MADTATPAPTLPPPSGDALTEESAAALLALLPVSDEPSAPEADAPPADDATPEPLDPKKDEDAPEPEPPAQPDLYEVVVDGKPERVTLEEMKKGYSRQQDYHRRVNETQKQQTEWAAEKARIQAEVKASRDQYAQKIERLDAAIGEIAPEEPNWDQIRKDTPERFPEAVAEWQLLTARRAKLAAERQKIVDEQDAEENTRFQARLATERDKLHQAIPALADPTKAPPLRERLVAAAATYGYTRDIVGATQEAGLIQMLHDAMQWQELNARAASLKGRTPGKDAPKAAPALSAGTRQAPLPKGRKAAQTAFAALKESGAISDAARAIRALEGLE